ncbi:YifB family Mg chelatase-like AAA ATPase [Candidatus Bodocaedibacter vickermanii]|uniref:AAA family ATPase n=1 Tax=Candidatus Bodocaedibacter vickermanii TaxID=2741701 RepID=A0A7L9RS58_9PROT|nr:AAA family ATPase [Candidatus Paracaedibacteraceae bacterium 'Lake Konstanz']
MLSRITTVAFQGIQAVPVDVQVQIANGLPAFNIVGLADKTVAESRERIRSALTSIGLSLPPKRITVNLSPADMQKEGSHFDLPIAIAVLIGLEVISAEVSSAYVALGELSLAGDLLPVNGVLPAAFYAASEAKKVICPHKNGPEATWGGGQGVLAPLTLIQLIQCLQGKIVLESPKPEVQQHRPETVDLSLVKGQETSKRALEITAAGGHNLLMIGSPGAGKSLLAACLPGILPELTPKEALEVSMIHSIAGVLNEGALLKDRPFRAPHHSASMPSLVGGGLKAKPGEISLAHNGVLFLDELPEFQRMTLEALRQPLETGSVSISRANARYTYPADVQFVAAMNPCRCGYGDDPVKACSKVPKCLEEYQSKISGPLMDRIDLKVYMKAVDLDVFRDKASAESSAVVKTRIMNARNYQQQRLSTLGIPVSVNANLSQKHMETACALSTDVESFCFDTAQKLSLSARGLFRTLKVARTIADLDESAEIQKKHISEAFAYRLI